jgi:hypothetical protein
VWRLFLYGVVLVGTFFLAGGLLATGLGGGSSIPGLGAALLLAGLVAGSALLRVDDLDPRALGLHAGPGVMQESGVGLGLGVGVALAAVVAMAAAGAVTWTVESVSPGAWLGSAMMALGFFALPAAAEEVVFRGYPLQALAEAWGPAAAVGVTSVGFGLLHLGNPGAGTVEAANVTVAGLVLGALVVRTGSLWLASGAHLGWNWAHGFLADLPVSGLDLVDAPGVVARVREDAWMGGGGFGPEGSLATTAVGLAAAAWTWWTPRLRPSPALEDVRLLMRLRRVRAGPSGQGSENAERHTDQGEGA